jgi:hypothetical protein
VYIVSEKKTSISEECQEQVRGQHDGRRVGVIVGVSFKIE